MDENQNQQKDQIIPVTNNPREIKKIWFSKSEWKQRYKRKKIL